MISPEGFLSWETCRCRRTIPRRATTTTSQGPPVFQGARATTDWCPSSEDKRRTVPQPGHEEHLATAGRRTRAEATWDATAGRRKTTRATAQAGSPLAF